MQIYSNHRYKYNIIYRPTCKMRINVRKSMKEQWITPYRFAMIHHCFAGEAVRLLAAFLQMIACEFAQVQDSVTFLFSPEGRRLVSCTYNALDKILNKILNKILHPLEIFGAQLGAEGAEAGVASTSVFTRPNHCYACYSCYSYCRYLAWDWDWCFCWNSEFLNAARSFSWEAGTIQWPKPKERCSRWQSVNDSREHTWKINESILYNCVVYKVKGSLVEKLPIISGLSKNKVECSGVEFRVA